MRIFLGLGFLPGQALALKVGSSFENRLSALEKPALWSRALGATASDITGSGTDMDVIASLQEKGGGRGGT